MKITYFLNDAFVVASVWNWILTTVLDEIWHVCSTNFFFLLLLFLQQHHLARVQTGSLNKTMLIPIVTTFTCVKRFARLSRWALLFLQPIRSIVNTLGLQVIRANNIPQQRCVQRFAGWANLTKHINQPTLLAPRPDSDRLWSWSDAECHRCLASSRPRPSRRVRAEAAAACLPAPSGRPDWRRRWTAWSGLDRP